MFIGESHHALDSKCRVFLPKRFQDELERETDGALTCFVTPGLDDCLYLFSVSGFRRAIERLDTAAFTSEQGRDVQRDFFSRVHRVKLDSSGRLLVPDGLRDKLRGAKEVTMVGCMERAEIWPRDVRESRRDADQGLSTMNDILSGRLPGRSTGGGAGADART